MIVCIAKVYSKELAEKIPNGIEVDQELSDIFSL